ncbi:MAG: hypothetical protein HY901_02670 [Deltaproteobacteria bacterium]|nr:hypothetical protein [Deltaproteobacteria bacterium]
MVLAPNGNRAPNHEGASWVVHYKEQPPAPGMDGLPVTCAAYVAEVRGDGCRLRTDRHSGEKQGVFIGSSGGSRPGCGESVEICKRTFTCECQKCDEVPGFGSRWTRGRKATRVPDGDRLRLVVEYDGGVCEGWASVHHEGWCMAAGSERSSLGGCKRQLSHNDENGCGKSVSFCGETVLCDCDAEGRGGIYDLKTPVAR